MFDQMTIDEHSDRISDLEYEVMEFKHKLNQERKDVAIEVLNIIRDALNNLEGDMDGY